jgi:hypothetical protein
MIRCGEDEDGNLEGVGSLERGEPTILLTDTLRHRFRGRFGVPGKKVRERRPRIGHGRGRKGEHPREMKTQERIGSIRSGNTGRLVARILAWLKPLKASSGPRGLLQARTSSDVRAGRRHQRGGPMGNASAETLNVAEDGRPSQRPRFRSARFEPEDVAAT